VAESAPDSPEAVADALNAVFPALVRLVLARQERRRQGRTPEERISPPQQLALLVLHDGPRGIGEVARGTGVAVSSATRMVQGLERAGFVVRHEGGADGDRRRRPVALTAEGRRVLEASVALRAGRLRDLVAPLTPAQRAVLVEGVEVVAHALQLAERRTAEG